MLGLKLEAMVEPAIYWFSLLACPRLLTEFPCCHAHNFGPPSHRWPPHEVILVKSYIRMHAVRQEKCGQKRKFSGIKYTLAGLGLHSSERSPWDTTVGLILRWYEIGLSQSTASGGRCFADGPGVLRYGETAVTFFSDVSERVGIKK